MTRGRRGQGVPPPVSQGVSHHGAQKCPPHCRELRRPVHAPRALRSTQCSAHWRNSSQIRANKCIHQHNCSTWNNFAVAMRSRCLDGRSDNCSTWNNFSRCAAPFARSGPPGGKSQIVPRGTIVLPDTGVGCALQKIARKYATRRARIEQQNQKPRHEEILVPGLGVQRIRRLSCGFLVQLRLRS